MKKSVLLIQCALVVILVAGFAGCAAAGSTGVSVTKANGAAYDHSKQIVGTNTATVSKEIGFTVTGNGGKFAYTASGPVSATSLDGRVTVSVDAMKLTIAGKTSGTGTATANATVLASGTTSEYDADVVTVVESEIAVDIGPRGSAEASASASGSAESTAIYEGTELSAVSSGSTTAYGKITGPSGALLNPFGPIPNHVGSEGEIVGIAHYGYTNGAYIIDPFCEVESSVEGTGTSTAKATANGVSGAMLVDPALDAIWCAKTSGNTAASGSSKNTGYFDVYAEVEALADRHMGDIAWTGIDTYAYTAGNDKYATATGTAIVKSGIASATATDLPNSFVGGVSGNATGTSSIRGIGWAEGLGEIYAESAEYGEFYWYDDFEELGYDLTIYGRLVDDAYLWGNAETGGGATGFVGSAAGSADGKATAAGYFFDSTQEGFAYGPSAVTVSGSVAASGTAKNTGWEDATAEMVSVDALDARVNLQIHAEGIEQFDEQLPADIAGLDLQQIPVDFYAPAFEASAIQQIVATSGETAKDSAEARAVAAGTAESEGTYSESDYHGEEISTWSADSYATGMVAGLSRANMCKDPTSTSVIVEFDTWTGHEDGVDIALVGSASYADGVCGTTEGMAVGSAGSDLAPGYTGTSAYAEGMAKTYAQANNAVSLALAGVGSGTYAGEGDGTILGANASLVDASLVGSAALSFGASGQAAAEAAGNTSASSTVVTADGAVSGGLSTIVKNGVTESAVRVKNGIAVDAAAVTSIGLMQLGQSGDILQDNYATGVSGVVDIALADAGGKNDVAEAAGMASGSTQTTGSFNVIDAENAIVQLGTINTAATGVVEDAVEAAFADPLAASAVASFVSINSEPDGIPSLVVDGSIVGSIAMAEGQSAKAAGAAAGSTQAGGVLMLTDDSNEEMEVVTNLFSMTNASAVAGTAAEAKGGLALSIAGDGSINVVAGTPDPNYNIRNVPEEPKVPLHAFLLGDLVELTPEQHDQMVGNLCTEIGMASEYLPREDLCETGGEIWVLLGCGDQPSATADMVDPLIVDGSLTGAASFVIGNAQAESAIVGGTDTEGFFTVAEITADPITVTPVIELKSNASAGGVVGTEVVATNGVALAAGGMGSLDIVAYEYGDEEAGISPTADLIEVSLLGDVAFADSFDKKATSWSRVDVVGATSANGGFGGLFVNEDGYLNVTYGIASSAAAGLTNGFARAYNCDPLSISLIGAISEVEADGTPNPVEFEVEDASFIATVSVAAGEGCGLANGGAIGEAATAHSENYNWVATGDRYQEAQSVTGGAFTSAVEVKNGMGIAATGADSEAEVEWERPPLEREADVEAGMGAYTGGFGFTSGSVVKASAGFADAYSDVYAVDTRVTNENVLLKTDAYVGGSGSSTVYVLGLNGAESMASENARAQALEGPASISQTEAWFGVQLVGSDASGIVATADMSDVDVYGNAYSRNPDVTYATVDMYDAGATGVLQPKVNTAAASAWNNQDYFSASLNGGYVEGGFAAVDTINDPNTAYAFRYARAQGQNGIPPVPTPDDFIVLW